MDVQRFIFKILVILTYLVATFAWLFPFAFAFVWMKEGGWKYGFTFIQNNVNVAFFIAFAIAFGIVMYHTLKSEIVGIAPKENYLKANQKVKVKGPMTIETLYNKLLDSDALVFKSIEFTGESIEARPMVFFMLDWFKKRFRINYMSPDRLSITKEGDIFHVNSRPFVKWWYMDFGRSFKHVTEVAKIIKRGE